MSLISIIPVVVTFILYTKMVQFEEKDLEKIFGEKYLEYKRKVPLWFPRIKPAKFDTSSFNLSDSAVDQATDLLKRFEGFVDTPQWDVNNWRIGHGSSTITKPDGTVIQLSSDQSVKPTETVTREDAARDLKRRLETEFIPKKVMPWVSADTPDGIIAALT